MLKLKKNKETINISRIMTMRLCIPNGCLDAYEVKVDIDIFQYQEKVKPISQFQIFFSFFNGLL